MNININLVIESLVFLIIFTRKWFYNVTVAAKICHCYFLQPPVKVYIDMENPVWIENIKVYWRIVILGKVPVMGGLFKHSCRVHIPTYSVFWPQLMGVHSPVIQRLYHHPGTPEPRSTALAVARCARPDRGRSPVIFGCDARFVLKPIGVVVLIGMLVCRWEPMLWIVVGLSSHLK